MLWIIIATAAIYLLYEKVLKFYYFYWYYKSQGVAVTSIPLPILGNLPQVKKAFDNNGTYDLNPLE